MDPRQGSLASVFRARKRKVNSPVTPSSSKSKKYSYDRASGKVVEIPVSSTGNLQAFLVNTKHEDKVSDADRGSVPDPGLLQPKFSTNKSWLIPCSRSSRSARDEDIREEIEDGGLERKGIGGPSPETPLKTQLVHSSPSPLKTQILQSSRSPVEGRLLQSHPGEVCTARDLLRTDAEETVISGAFKKPEVAATQFADEFLSLCFSGVSSSNSAKTLPGEPPAFQQKRKEQEFSDHAGRKKLCTDWIPTHNKQGIGYEPVPSPFGKQKNVSTGKDGCRTFDSPRDAKHQPFEEQPRVCSLLESSNEDVSRRGKISEKGMCDTPRNMGSHQSAAGLRNDALRDKLGMKQLSTPRSVISKVRTVEESSGVARQSGIEAPSGGTNFNAVGEGSSKPSPGEPPLCTPQAGNNKNCNFAGDSYYRSSLFSPGDEFWDEAIQLVLASKIDFQPTEVNEKGSLVGASSKLSGTHEQGLKSSKSVDKHQRSTGHGNLPPKQHKQLQTGKLHSGSENEGMSVKENAAPGPGVVSAVNGLQEVTVVKSEKVLSDSDCVPKAHRDGPGLGGWLKQLVVSPVSPLPVRRFDFSSKGEKTDGSVVKGELEEKKSNGHIMDKTLSREEEGHLITFQAGDPGRKLVKDLPLCREKTANAHIMEKEVLREEGSQLIKIQGGDLEFFGGKVAQDHHPAIVADLGASSKETDSAPDAVLGASLESSVTKAVVSQDDSTAAGEVVVLQEASGVSQHRSLELSDWIPAEVSAVYAKKGLKQLYPWQVECLQLDGVLDGRNLVYSASTSAGKSLVAEMLMIRRIVSTGRMALLVLPFVSICSEKADHLAAVLEPIGKKVRNFFGTQGSATVPKDTSVAVCTIEKANSLINKLLEDNRLSEVGLVIIDELHMVGDKDRGYLLELLLTKIRFACGELDNIRVSSQEKSLAIVMPEASPKLESKADLQVIGMSATMPNIGAVAHWLQAALYETDFRPVPLEEFIKVGNVIYNRKMEIAWTIRKGADLCGKDPDHVVELCHDVVKEGHSVLVFCSSRKACEYTAIHIAKFLPSQPQLPGKVEGADTVKDAAAAIEELRKSSSGLDPVLAQTLPYGVAYHHAGLTVEEREIVEQCFKQGVVRVLTATSTLAAGVNLPARRVIFRQPKIGRDFLDGTRYRQMAGRAGRAGIDTKGESVLICKPEEVKRMKAILSNGCQPLQSCLTDDKIGMMRALLEVVAGGIVQSAQDVNRYVRCTLFNSTQSFDRVVKSVQDSLCWLCRKKFVEWSKETQVYTSTPLGRAAFGSSLSPEESLVVFEDLAKAREGFVLASDLHLVYQVTPIYVELEPDWSLFYQKFVELSHLEQAVAGRVGVFEPFLMRMAHGAPVPSASKSKGLARSPAMRGRFQTVDALRVCKRFYVALMLSKLVQEVPLVEVSDAFKVPRGTVQALQASAGRFAAMVSGFCERLGWQDMEGLVSKFQSRVSFGVRSEIVELTEIPFVKGARARALYKAGLRTIQAVAEASIPELIKALSEASVWSAQDDSRRNTQHRMLLGVVRKVKNGAQRIVLERAEDARIAAFSAIQALGVIIPQSLWPPISSNLAVTSAVIEEDALDRFFEPAAVDGVSGIGMDQIQTGSNLGQNAVHALAQESTVQHMPSNAAGVAKAVVTDGLKHLLQTNRLAQNDKENQVGSGKVLDVSHDRTSNRCESNIESFVQKYKEAASSALNLNHLFGGVELLKEKSLKENLQDKPDVLEKVNSGPVDVDTMEGGFKAFLQLWVSVEEYFFDLNYKNQITEASVQVFEIEGIAICWKDSPVYYVSLARIVTCNSEKERGSGKDNGLIDSSLNPKMATSENAFELLNIIGIRWKNISDVLSKLGSRKVSWNLKNQLRALLSAGVSPATGNIEFIRSFSGHSSKQNVNDLHHLPSTLLGEPFVDVHVVAWLLWPDEESSQSFTLEQLVKRRLPGEDAANASRAGRWTNQMARVAHNGCCRRVAQTRALYFALWKLLIIEGLHHPLLQIEMPMVKVLAEMESSGIGVDMEACCHIRNVTELRIKGLEASAHKLAGTRFALSVPGDVANTLYKHLKLPVPPGCNKGKQHPSTNRHALDFLRHHHPIAAVIQEHRKLSKLLHSTLASIVVWSRPHLAFQGLDIKERVKQVHFIFGRWLQTSTATGRLSMEEPNLQCVENTICLGDTNEGSNDKVEINTRQLFVPAQEKWIILSADYSQIEVRLMAHFSQDVALVDLLSRPSGDLFRMITAQWTGISDSAVTDKQREQTKRLVYGILYGMGVHALAEQLDCSVAEASLYLERFKSAFPGVHSWLERACVDCRQRGFVTTLGGRKRFLEKINSGNHAEQARAERQAVNAICQGSAADLIKMAMIKLHAVIARNAVEGTQLSIKGHCRLLLQIHDELVLEVDKDFLKEVSNTLRSCMEDAASLKVPLRVKLQVGKAWGCLNPLDDSLM